MTNNILSVTDVQLWGGVEGTFNRVGDRYFHQMRRSGHWDRMSDLDLVAALGIRTLRYPLLWELTAPTQDPNDSDWSWGDARTGRMRELGIRPILGLVHHGSGPPHTSLVDARFADGLASYARACAERYPWVEDYTPINEPLTTARFSALYGVWYPHARDDLSFVRALINQCRATVLAMQQVRQVNPRARLIQTEDVGTVTGTRLLTYQAEFENQRRWLSFDLLCGRVDRHHPLYEYLLKGSSQRELEFFTEAPCPPDVIGINYYVTSDRYLDEHIEQHEPRVHGGNGRHAYADIESVRSPVGLSGHRATLLSVWQRYKLPIALTEVHIDCHREEQLRWLAEAWHAAVDLRQSGVDVQAVTLWALFGSYDWNSLCTRDGQHYESGAFDLRSGSPRPTAIARAALELATHGTFSHPTLNARGWWRRIVTRPRKKIQTLRILRNDESVPPPPLLIIGADAALGRAFRRACDERALDYVALDHTQIDLDDRDAVLRLLGDLRPWSIINAAECLPEQGHLTVTCAEQGIALVTICTDPAFPNCPDFTTNAIRVLRAEGSVHTPHDVFVAPIFVHDLVRVALDTLVDGETDVWHVSPVEAEMPSMDDGQDRFARQESVTDAVPVLAEVI